MEGLTTTKAGSRAKRRKRPVGNSVASALVLAMGLVALGSMVRMGSALSRNISKTSISESSLLAPVRRTSETPALASRQEAMLRGLTQLGSLPHAIYDLPSARWVTAIDERIGKLQAKLATESNALTSAQSTLEQAGVAQEQASYALEQATAGARYTEAPTQPLLYSASRNVDLRRVFKQAREDRVALEQWVQDGSDARDRRLRRWLVDIVDDVSAEVEAEFGPSAGQALRAAVEAPPNADRDPPISHIANFVRRLWSAEYGSPTLARPAKGKRTWFDDSAGPWAIREGEPVPALTERLLASYDIVRFGADEARTRALFNDLPAEQVERIVQTMATTEGARKKHSKAVAQHAELARSVDGLSYELDGLRAWKEDLLSEDSLRREVALLPKVDALNPFRVNRARGFEANANCAACTVAVAERLSGSNIKATAKPVAQEWLTPDPLSNVKLMRSLARDDDPVPELAAFARGELDLATLQVSARRLARRVYGLTAAEPEQLRALSELVDREPANVLVGRAVEKSRRDINHVYHQLGLSKEQVVTFGSARGRLHARLLAWGNAPIETKLREDLIAQAFAEARSWGPYQHGVIHFVGRMSKRDMAHAANLITDAAGRAFVVDGQIKPNARAMQVLPEAKVKRHMGRMLEVSVAKVGSIPAALRPVVDTEVSKVVRALKSPPAITPP